ncbi:MAG: hypothetical protein ACI837_003431 [Crocinitomicaceae bacterium]|jgi:hypothetical protein
MRIANYLLITGITALLFSCGNEVEKDIANSTVSQEEHDHTSESIDLDNGSKWKVIDSMMVHIENMEADLKQFEDLKETDYSLLASKLTANIDLLTSSCTMTGKAHDELHKWLLPYIDLVTELSDAENQEEQIGALNAIHSSFETFNAYFE